MSAQTTAVSCNEEVKHYSVVTEQTKISQVEKVFPRIATLNIPVSFSRVMNCLDVTETGSHTIDLPVTPMSVEKFERLNNSHVAYRMSSPIRGRCLIINNKDFDTLEARIGSEKDVENIQRVFGKLFFTCQVVEDLTIEGMKQAIKEETKREEHHQYGMFVLIIMSHGENGRVTGTDGSHLELTQVYSLLSPAEFPAMDGKPKLVIIQACAGPRRSPEVAGDSETTRSPTTDSMEESSWAPDDFFIAKAAFDGTLASRLHQSGSLFIRALLVALCEYSCHLDFDYLFRTLVQHVVKKRSRSTELQAPTSQNHLLKKLYLCPGANQDM